MTSYRRILVIAGSDSSGGAGLEADQKVIAAHGCYAMTATTALTAQNTRGVSDIHHTPPAFVKKQISACLEDVGTDVVKCGMLSSAETVRIVAAVIREFKVSVTVIDPVMVSTSGAQLLPQEAVKTLREELIPLTTLLTPNIPEARLLLSDVGMPTNDIQSVDDLVQMARSVQSMGSKYVLLKGGHLPLANGRVVSSPAADTHEVIDVLYGNDKHWVFRKKYISSQNTHGTGCSLASAIACNLANGLAVPKATHAGCRYVEAGIKTSMPLGRGNGPIYHFHSSYRLPFAPGYFVEWLLDREDVQAAWKEHTEHKFVQGLGDGTLPLENFKYYLIQDYLYLVQFSRANALAAYKAKNMDDIGASAAIVIHIKEEMKLHLDYCTAFGISKEEVESSEESQACTAYTRYMLDVGQAEDWFALQIAFAPCLLGYGMIARRLYDAPTTKREGNTYLKWIENYIAEDYTTAVKVGSELIEKYAIKQSPSRIEELVGIFIHATKMETGFWDMGAGGAKS